VKGSIRGIYLKYYLGVCLEKLKKITETLVRVEINFCSYDHRQLDGIRVKVFFSNNIDIVQQRV
jgi:hypothetical protein